MVNMKVKLLARKGMNKAGSVVDYNDTTGEWMVSHGYAEVVDSEAAPKAADKVADDTADEAPAAPRRGRPPKVQVQS
jgi:hypothetical protein